MIAAPRNVTNSSCLFNVISSCFIFRFLAHFWWYTSCNSRSSDNYCCWILFFYCKCKTNTHICVSGFLCLWFVNSLRPRQNGRLFADDTFKGIFLNEDIRILTENSLKFVPRGLINNIPAMVLIMAWRRPGGKPLSEPMLVRSLTHICVTRPQWVKFVFVNKKLFEFNWI